MDPTRPDAAHLLTVARHLRTRGQYLDAWGRPARVPTVADLAAQQAEADRIAAAAAAQAAADRVDPDTRAAVSRRRRRARRQAARP